ncbi:MAG: hypothetical protein EOP02_08550 [Proteobacteria bacterium]|nr:MAG: hypothetical protein EOP02_08550 [Pseudomonadota bacterium]
MRLPRSVLHHGRDVGRSLNTHVAVVGVAGVPNERMIPHLHHAGIIVRYTWAQRGETDYGDMRRCAAIRNYNRAQNQREQMVAGWP